VAERRVVEMRAIALLLTLMVGLLGCAHLQPPERKVYVISEGTYRNSANEGPGIGGAGAESYCNELEKKCFSQCWNSAPEYSSIKKGSAKHHEECTKKCRQEFMECVKQQEALEAQERQGHKKELRFSNIDSALGWLRSHKTEIAVGTVVVVAGIAFVVATGGSGALLLTPLGL
jgi:hypothetical protein